MKPNIERLEKLVTVLEQAKPEQFDMTRYCWYGWESTGFKCGTPACVLGHYASRSDVQRTFKLTAYGTLIHRKTGACVDFDSEYVLEHFGIDEYQAGKLFDGNGCNNAETPAEAIAFIRKFIASVKPADIALTATAK